MRTFQTQHIIYKDTEWHTVDIELPWDASLEDYVLAFYCILRRATFSHDLAKWAFNKKEYKNLLE